MGEPMDMALQLLKGAAGSVRGMGSGGFDAAYHYPHELDYNAMGAHMQENTDSTLGSLVTPYLQGQFTSNPPTNPPAYQEERPTQATSGRNSPLQSTVPAPFPQTEEQTQGVQNLIDEGFESYEARNKKMKPQYDSMNNAVRVLSRGLRENPAFLFQPPGRLRTGKKHVGRSREMQNLKLRSLLDTPVSANMAEWKPPLPEPMRGIPVAAGEPMDIALQLLKERKYHPGHTSEIGMDGDSSLIDEAQRRENAYREAYIDGEYNPGEFGPWWQGPPQTTETLGTQDEDSQFTRNKIPVDSAAIVRRLMGKELPIRVQQARIQDDEGPSFLGMPFNEKTGFTKSLLKERKSPEAWAHKRAYDSQYEKTPKRVKYREQLNAERRRRGIYGRGGSDVSHTQGGGLTLENPSSNRARHFKGKGTLRRVKVK